MRRDIVAGHRHDPLQRVERVADRAKIERDQIGLAVGQHRHGRRRFAKMRAVIEFGQRRLYRAVAAVDDENLGAHPRDRAQRLPDLARQQRAVAGRQRIGEERDPRHQRAATATGLKDSPSI